MASGAADAAGQYPKRHILVAHCRQDFVHSHQLPCFKKAALHGSTGFSPPHGHWLGLRGPFAAPYKLAGGWGSTLQRIYQEAQWVLPKAL
jgi:hypothetical protein